MTHMAVNDSRKSDVRDCDAKCNRKTHMEPIHTGLHWASVCVKTELLKVAGLCTYGWFKL